MLTAIMGGEVLRAGVNLKGKDFVYRCRDPQCPSPEMILVAGERGIRVPHFRHRANMGCKCGAGETEWHLEWKSHFDRIEVDMGIDPVTGERNRADAVAGENLVIEFQHSPISLEEQTNRERFYTSKGGLVWVVDASKKRSVARFEHAYSERAIVPWDHPMFPRCHLSAWPDEAFPDGWSNRPVGVIFDYGEGRNFYGEGVNLVFLFPGRREEKAICRFLSKDECVGMLIENPSYFMKSVFEIENEAQERAEAYEEELKAKRSAQNNQVYRTAVMLHPTDNPNVQVDQFGCYWLKAPNGKYYPAGKRLPYVPPFQRRFARRKFRL